jgi:iron complex transport system permease protein
MAQHRERVLICALAICLVLLILVSLTVGSYDITVPQIAGIVWRQLSGAGNSGDQAATVLLIVRLPRIVLAALVGAALALSGAAYQGMFRNPMVSPDILGVSSGAGVGAAAALLLGLPTLLVHAVSFGCGIAAVLLVMGLSRAVSGKSQGNLVVMILAGVILSSVFSALTSLVKYLADANDVLPEFRSVGQCDEYADHGHCSDNRRRPAASTAMEGEYSFLRRRRSPFDGSEYRTRSRCYHPRCHPAHLGFRVHLREHRVGGIDYPPHLTSARGPQLQGPLPRIIVGRSVLYASRG